jgi:site-specific DNA-methyltransferase (adenine-specific)
VPGELVYVNPPYSRALPVWVDKCIEEARRGASIILLVPARTDTRWFTRAYEAAEAVCLWSGRLKFLNADPAAPSPEVMWDKKKSAWVPVCGAAFPSAVFLFGDRHARAFRQVFAPKGIMVTP